MRIELQRRFVLFYRYYRLKKFGEPLPVKDDNEFDIGEVEDFCDEEDKALLRRIKAMQK